MMIYYRSAINYTYGLSGYPINGPLDEVYIHHFNSGIIAPQTVGDSLARVINADRYHGATQGWGGIAYSWLVDDLGNIFEGRGWFRTGAHTYGYNSKGYAICWLGDSNVSRPTRAALAAMAALVRVGVNAGALVSNPTIVAHRDRVPDTSCPGDVLYGQLDEIRALASGRVDPPSPASAPTTEEEFMGLRLPPTW